MRQKRGSIGCDVLFYVSYEMVLIGAVWRRVLLKPIPPKSLASDSTLRFYRKPAEVTLVGEPRRVSAHRRCSANKVLARIGLVMLKR